MFFNRVFRESALRRRARQEPLDDRLQITAPHEWLIVSGLAVMSLALLSYATFGSIQRTLSYEATLVAPGERHFLVAPASGTVLDVFVEESDMVVPGQAIAHIRTTRSQQWDKVIESITNSLANGESMAEANELELLRAMLAATEAAEAGSEIEIVSPYSGRVMSLQLAPGQTVSAGANVGLVREESEGHPDVVVFVPESDAALLREGMEAQVSISGARDGNAQLVSGKVASVSAIVDVPPQWLLPEGSFIPRRPYELRVGLEDATLEPPLVDGTGASLRVVLGRESIISLLRPVGGG